MATEFPPHRFPRFETLEEEGRHRKQRLAAAFPIFAAHGFGEGTAGHITARTLGPPNPLEAKRWHRPIDRARGHFGAGSGAGAR